MILLERLSMDDMDSHEKPRYTTKRLRYEISRVREDVARRISELEAENVRLTNLLTGRDDFIVNQGLWGDFVATLPNTRRVREGGK